MGKFTGVLDKIAKGIEDMSSLEVVHYKGTIKAAAVNTDADFKTILDSAKGEAGFKITACTYVELDGDMRVFYDNEITQAEMDAHNALVEVAKSNRQAVVDMFKDAILKLT